MYYILRFRNYHSPDGSPLIVLNSQFLVDASKMLTLPTERNTSTNALIQRLHEKSAQWSIPFTLKDAHRFKSEIKELNETGRLTRQLARWLWILVDITKDKQVKSLIGLLQVGVHICIYVILVIIPMVMGSSRLLLFDLFTFFLF